MALKNQYLIDLLETVKKRNAGEPEFIQALTEVLESLEPGSVSTAAAHFIHALNTHTCSLDSVTADISSYLNAGENGRLYGCMNVSSLSESSGAFVISAGYEK